MASADQEPLSREDLERLYEFLGRLTITEERLLLRSMRSAVRAALWRLHLQSYLAHPALSADQRACLGEGIELLSDDRFFDLTADGERLRGRTPAYEEHVHKAESLFKPEWIGRLFHKLGRHELP